jgi:hypothetical protein
VTRFARHRISRSDNTVKSISFTQQIGMKTGTKLFQCFFSHSQPGRVCGKKVPNCTTSPVLPPPPPPLPTPPPTTHSGAKKAHDWSVDQLVDLLRTTDKVKT